MKFKELLLGLESINQRLIPLDILLRPVDYSNESKFQRVDSPGEDFQSIGTVVHQIQFGQHTDCPLALRINLTGKLKSLRVHKVDIGWRDC